jgi:hypothetical protein
MTAYRRWTALLTTAAFMCAMVAPRRALAWNEQTHQRLVDFSFQIAKLVEFEKTQGHRIPELQGLSGLPDLLAPPPECTGDCIDFWNDFLEKLADARTRLNEMPYGPATSGLRFNETCAPEVGVALGDFGYALEGKPPSEDRTSDICLAQRIYEEGGIFDSPDLRSLDGRLTGNSLGFVAQAADARVNDWDIDVDPIGAILGALAKIPLIGSAIALLGPIVVSIVDTLRDIAGSILGLVLGALFWLFTGGDPDAFQMGAELGVLITNIDREFVNVVDLETLAAEPKDDVGLGHYVNVQAQVVTGNPFKPVWPANNFDDRQGLYYREAFYNAHANPNTSATLVQDSMDHYIMDNVEQFGTFIDPGESYGVQNYQIFSTADGHDDSEPRAGSLSLSSNAYWRYNRVSQIAFTPLDNLAFHGWRRWQDASCQDASLLQWTLHAIGDASCPMHAIGTTGQGHRPFEDSIEQHPGQWEKIRFLAPKELEGGVDGDAEYSGNTAQRDQAFRDQYAQAKSILAQAIQWRELISDFQDANPADFPVRDFVTAVANTTLTKLRDPAVVPRLSCETLACGYITLEWPPDDEEEVRMRCTGNCTGFVGDATPVRGSDPADQTADPTDGSTPECHVSGVNPFNVIQCPEEFYVAKALGAPQSANTSYPAILAPGLAARWKFDGDTNAESFYRNYVPSQRAFFEIGTAASLVILAYMSDLMKPVPSSCIDSCPGSEELCGIFCVDTSSDNRNCGACGTICEEEEFCLGGECVPDVE